MRGLKSGGSQESDMKDVIQRLTASKIRMEDEDGKSGYRLGRQWAREYAEVRDLKRIEDFWEESGTHFHTTFGELNHHTPGELIASALNPDLDDIDRATSDFWAPILGDGYQEMMMNVEFMGSFLYSAQEVWLEVKDQI